MEIYSIQSTSATDVYSSWPLKAHLGHTDREIEHPDSQSSCKVVLTRWCVWIFRPTRVFFTHRLTSQLLVKGIYSTFIAIELWVSCSVQHPLWHGASFYDDSWHSHVLPSVWQWSCHYLFQRLWSFHYDNSEITARFDKENTCLLIYWQQMQF